MILCGFYILARTGNWWREQWSGWIRGASERIRELVGKGREEGCIEKVGEEGEWRPFNK
jgi:hypothetical protein